RWHPPTSTPFPYTTLFRSICANADQWPLVQRVARQDAGERVRGSLGALVRSLVNALAIRSASLSNELLERNPGLLPLVDGIDATDRKSTRLNSSHVSISYA